MIDRNALIIIENNELPDILHFEFELIYALKHNFSFKFITSTKK